MSPKPSGECACGSHQHSGAVCNHGNEGDHPERIYCESPEKANIYQLVQEEELGRTSHRSKGTSGGCCR